jgi:hypothetical protein
MSTTLETIFGYEVLIETAWQELLEQAYNSSAALSAVKVFTQATDAQKPTPYVDIELRRVAALTTQHLDPATKHTFYAAWEGRLVARVVTTRGRNSNLHNDILAVARAQFANFQELLDLPFHTVFELKDYDSIRGVHADALADFTEAEYIIKFSADPDSWP